MSDLRYFADLMHEAIQAERRLRSIEERAATYIEKCSHARAQALEHRGDRMPPSFYEANEGAVAARMILGAA